ncbi:MAG: choline dehydrogenase [Gammaproteobacteria bacterium]|nr:choline dehydrogenase [Gammaproteobacteria bacterium]NIR82962.1 choline dehydrogenase [Gammaproteobacteria bacterium]NIR90327.1 choline dehydrogenase [Gammaproteobacteria bacterium]NIU04108.1 choline dehydrogenase [Gammaproteobacteria bacterium]NIV51404.1 choline dehydrogenase [Gammaproteobacteria bacterium]
MAKEDSFDYIIVGAGSAGCVLAHRLTNDAGVSALLLETGPKDKDLFIHMPSAFAYALKDDKYNWYYQSEAERYMDGRRMYCPRGRVLGGSSSINGMIFVRGNPMDFDRWAQETGYREWSYAHVLPYFQRAETYERGANDYRGGDGPLFVSAGSLVNPLYDAFIEAGFQAGYPLTEDMNGYQQEGFGRMDMTIHNGRRWSTAAAYLRPALTRPNLHLEVRALATRILFEGNRAVGVEYACGNRIQSVRARREVILSAGAINSPQVLMLSGVGPADELKRHGISVVQDLRGVGENLQDHLEIYIQYACNERITLYSATRGLRRARIGLEWLLFRKGLGATNHFEAGAFIRTRDDVPHPDLQYHFLPLAVSYDGSSALDADGFQAHVGPMRPTSVGHVKLRSPNPREAPLILFNYMQTEGDRREMRDGVRLTREILAQQAFDRYRGSEIAPGDGVRTDAEIDAFVRAKGESAYHPVGTCRMGEHEAAVVDGACRVHGLEGLRVVDASIMPSITSGNTNAPTIMIAEKAADLILGERPLYPRNVPVYDARGTPARRPWALTRKVSLTNPETSETPT